MNEKIPEFSFIEEKYPKKIKRKKTTEEQEKIYENKLEKKPISAIIYKNEAGLVNVSMSKILNNTQSLEETLSPKNKIIKAYEKITLIELKEELNKQKNLNRISKNYLKK